MQVACSDALVRPCACTARCSQSVHGVLTGCQLAQAKQQLLATLRGQLDTLQETHSRHVSKAEGLEVRICLHRCSRVTSRTCCPASTVGGCCL